MVIFENLTYLGIEFYNIQKKNETLFVKILSSIQTSKYDLLFLLKKASVSAITPSVSLNVYPVSYLLTLPSVTLNNTRY